MTAPKLTGRPCRTAASDDRGVVMRAERARLTRDVTVFHCISCGDEAELLLRRGDRADHRRGWAKTRWIDRAAVTA